ALGLLALAILILWPKKWQAVPASIVAVIVPTIAVVAMHLGVQTVGTKFGGIPSGFPALNVPHFSFAQIQELMAPALTIAVLGAIESLLSAMVADGMIETRHDSNQELIGQGLANIVTPFFGGISATGAIARTATNVRAGGKTPVAGIAHAIAILAVTLALGSLAAYLVMPALAALLMVTAWLMSEPGRWPERMRLPAGDRTLFFMTMI